MPQSPLPPQQPPIGTDSESVLWMEGDARRAWASTKYTEAITRGGAAPGRLPGNAPLIPNEVFRVTTTVTARLGSTYGTGAGIRQDDSGTALSDSADANASQTLKNLLDKPITSGASSWVICSYAKGKWWVVAPASCSIVGP